MTAQTDNSCEHVWKYQGTVYRPDRHPLPGSGARALIYGDRYFCEKCLETRLINERICGNDYGKPLAGTLPA